ncbi:hypothetical protein EDB84DRAFT_1564690 [Lactarius hengduanensis]|nr:hypothetical protein EDB84DRAFT_1564690 [Lactarius hengduanensis]
MATQPTLPPDTSESYSQPQADPGPEESPPGHVLFDDPDANVVLRSGDSQIFRLPKLYIIRGSTVLSELIRAASNTSGAASAGFASAGSRSTASRSPAVRQRHNRFLPAHVHLPRTSVLPSSLDEKMELLSVAQKYEMSSVMDHVRGSLSQQDPPFIHKENAFLAYSLAQKYGLRREAIQAARFTLKSTLTNERFKDVTPGAYLQELRKYHQRVQAQLKLDLPSSGAGTLFNAFDCISQYTTGSRHWFHSYIASISENPSFFDPIEFQMALMRHTAGTVSNVVWKSVAGIWTGCPGSKAGPSTKKAPALPAWLYNCFMPQIEELKQNFTRPLINPTVVRKKYLEALRRHAPAVSGSSGQCTFCLEGYAMKGDDYCTQLEQAIARAREKASIPSRIAPVSEHVLCSREVTSQTSFIST